MQRPRPIPELRNHFLADVLKPLSSRLPGFHTLVSAEEIARVADGRSLIAGRY